MRGRHQRKPARPLGVMVSERKIETTPSAVRLAKRYGFDAASLPYALGLVAWLRQRPEVIQAMAQHPAKRTSMNHVTAECNALDAALTSMSIQEVAGLRLQWLMHITLNLYN